MNSFDFLPPDPGLVDLIRQGLHAHKAENGARERLLRPVPAPVPPDAPGEARPTTRLALAPSPSRLAAAA